MLVQKAMIMMNMVTNTQKPVVDILFVLLLFGNIVIRTIATSDEDASW